MLGVAIPTDWGSGKMPFGSSFHISMRLPR